MAILKRRKYRQLSDEELLKLFRSQTDSAIIGIFYERYGHLVFGVALKYLKNVVEAEDMCMKVFEDLSLKIQKHEIQRFKSWLHTVTRNECLMLMRKNKWAAHDIDELQLAIEDETWEIQEKQLTQLESAILDLKSPQKECIELFYLKQLSYQQVADQLKLTINAVKSAIQNGKRNLKLQLDKEDVFKTT